MTIEAQWCFTNRKGFSFSIDKPLNELRVVATEAINKLKENITAKYKDTEIEVTKFIDCKWEADENEEAHEDVRVSIIISKQGRKGIKEREVYGEVNKIKTAYFKKLVNK
jgi:hypothetical protein